MHACPRNDDNGGGRATVNKLCGMMCLCNVGEELVARAQARAGLVRLEAADILHFLSPETTHVLLIHWTSNTNRLDGQRRLCGH